MGSFWVCLDGLEEERSAVESGESLNPLARLFGFEISIGLDQVPKQSSSIGVLESVGVACGLFLPMVIAQVIYLIYRI